MRGKADKWGTQASNNENYRSGGENCRPDLVGYDDLEARRSKSVSIILHGVTKLRSHLEVHMFRPLGRPDS